MVIDRGSQEHSERQLSLCQFVQHKSLDCPGFESGRLNAWPWFIRKRVCALPFSLRCFSSLEILPTLKCFLYVVHRERYSSLHCFGSRRQVTLSSFVVVVVVGGGGGVVVVVIIIIDDCDEVSVMVTRQGSSFLH